MKYILFSQDIYISDGIIQRRLDRAEDLNDSLGSNEKLRLCVVDIDVLIAASVENPIEKKDNLLVRKFKELYQHESYIIQDERIDNNLFQVIEIKEQKVREVYSLIATREIETFIPYGIALRNALINRNIDLNKTIVFIDDFSKERLITVFDGLKFSRTRAVAQNEADILPEIKRSQIDFYKKNEEYILKKNAEFLILVNNQDLLNELKNNDDNLSVSFIDLPYPAQDGLKINSSLIKYRLPEEILKKRQEIEFRKNLLTWVFSSSVVFAAALYFLFNSIEAGFLKHQGERLQQINESLNEQLIHVDRGTYREDLKRRKSLNYGVSYLAILNIVPSSYEVNTFKLIRSDHWNLELSLSLDHGETYGPIRRFGVLRNAEIKDVIVNNQVGKHIKVIL